MSTDQRGCWRNFCPPMDLMRSEPMQLVQIIIPTESAHLTVSYLGELGLLQFKDLNAGRSSFQLKYAAQVKRCGEMARILRLLKEQMTKAGVSPSPLTTPQPQAPQVDFDDMEERLVELEKELVEFNNNNGNLQRNYSELLEYKLVLEKAGEFFSDAQSSATEYHREVEEVVDNLPDGAIENPVVEHETLAADKTSSKQVNLGFVTGIVPKEKANAFERVLFRATKGNMFLKQSLVEELVTDPLSGEKVSKNVFVVFCSGEGTKTKILKICEAFGANRYPFTDDLEEQRNKLAEVSEKISELNVVIDAGEQHCNKLLSNISSQYEQWNLLVKKEKSVYHTLNMLSLDVTGRCLFAEGWSPNFASAQIRDALNQATEDSNSQMSSVLEVLQTKESPPTYFKTNKFTSSFQEIIDAYGVSRYQEANPGVFTIVTFPFLFAVMFGDWGHGLCLLAAIMYFIIREKKLSTQKLGDITSMIFGGRYVILLMALYSIYAGFVYNEFFSVPFEIFGRSAYACSDHSCSDANTKGLVMVGSTYPFGVDPKWLGSRTELPFLNSLKMKLSILLGVAQMNLGIILSYFNGMFFGNGLNIWYQFVPQFIFMNSLFGYLSFLIILKWCTGSKADLYHIMIYMFLKPTDDLGENQLFEGQKTAQLVFLFLAFVSVPWMLLPKPFLLRRKYRNSLHQGHAVPLLQTDHSDNVELESDHNEQEEEEDFNFSDIFVHQLIHTIEFVLGAVSNTASYLRLWALSLAHSELGGVFYEKVLLLAWGYRKKNFIIPAVGFIIFLCATVGVLLVMETLSAFLHALRLHWVEFQNKFYEGDGYMFTPFSFAMFYKEEEEEN